MRALLLLLLVPGLSRSEVLVQMDGLWYRSNASSTARYYAGESNERFMDMTPALMSNCVRATGGLPTPSGMPIVVGPNFEVVFSEQPIKLMLLPVKYIRVRTYDGNVVCSGQIPEPAGFDAVFSNGFERG